MNIGDRNGKLRRYVGRPVCAALVGLPGSPEFMQAYQDAMSGAVPVARSGHKPGTLGALAADFFEPSDFANLAASSRATYRKVPAEYHFLWIDLANTST